MIPPEGHYSRIVRSGGKCRMIENGDLPKEKVVGELLALRRRIAKLEASKHHLEETEQELLAAKAGLEREVEQRTAELRTTYERLHSG